jgi:tetratricopeptide (TPR) repeat protein
MRKVGRRWWRRLGAGWQAGCRRLGRWTFRALRPLRRLGRRVEGRWLALTWLLGLATFLAFRPLRRLGRLVAAWWGSRSFRRLLAGLPALLAGAGVVAVAAMALASESDLAGRYRQEAAHRFQAKEYEAARICFERLVALDGARPETSYGLAVTLEALGEHERAAALLADLAPRDRQGHAPAHFLQARRLLAAAQPSAEAAQAAEVHLLRTLRAQPENSEAHALLGQLYLTAGRLDQAERHLAGALGAHPELRLALARLHVVRGQRGLAREEAEQALRLFREKAEADPDDHKARLHWAAAAVFLEDFPAAVAALQHGLALSGEASYRPALAEAYGTWSDVLGREGKATPGARLALLEQGLRYDPANLNLLRRLLPAAGLRGPEADQARAALRRALAQGQAAATVHMLLGVDAWQRGKTAEARQHYELALQLEPRMAVVANNLAWLLAHSEPPDLPRALSLANAALESLPNERAFRDTRGHILARMGRWREALLDLEAVLAERPDNRDLHRLLAEAYRHLGLPDMAAEHQRRASAGSPQEGRR